MSRGDHPRVCGENLRVTGKAVGQRGSPPRVRGKLLLVRPHAVGERITPACAGKTSTSFSYRLEARDHPRVCGENKIDVTLRYRDPGSPPRVRGKRAPIFAQSAPVRITPACAGKTASCGKRACEMEDHPRVCGENISRRWKREPGRRITPACAGKTAHARLAAL